MTCAKFKGTAIRQWKHLLTTNVIRILEFFIAQIDVQLTIILAEIYCAFTMHQTLIDKHIFVVECI